MKSKKLLPCKGCKDKAHVVHNREIPNARYYIGCWSVWCACQISRPTLSEATTDWNSANRADSRERIPQIVVDKATRGV